MHTLHNNVCSPANENSSDIYHLNTCVFLQLTMKSLVLFLLTQSFTQNTASIQLDCMQYKVSIKGLW
jgi:hypothetical protein